MEYMENDISRELIVRAGQGDMKAFEDIYRLTSGFVYNVALRIARRHAEAEDITQEVFIKMHAALPQFGFRSSCKTWLYRITANTAISRCRKFSRESDLAAKYRDHLEVEAQETPAAADENEKMVGDMLAKLDDDQRTCVVLRDMEGLSYDEIAEILKIPLNTVRSRLHRARETLLEFARKEKTL
jgi:RNA polymerase sigma-70 factor (ECF subfamily)